MTIIIIIVVLTLGMAGFFQQPQFGQPPSGEDLIRISQSAQYQDGTFHNLDGVKNEIGFGKGLTLIPEFFSSEGNKVPKDTLPITFHTAEDFISTPDSVSRITWFGHSAFMVEMDGKRLLLDPMLGPHASPISSFGKRFTPSPIQPTQLPYVDAVLFSHDHYDHLDYYTITRIRDSVGHFFVPLGVGSHLRRWGVPADRITELDWWQEVEYEDFTFACTPAQHFSGRGVSDRDHTLWGSWVIIGEWHKLYFSGDGGYFRGFKEIGDKYGPFDLCMMECGQYNQLWHEIHMMPEETFRAFLDLRGRVLMPIHWGAFNLALHSWDDPILRLLAEAERHRDTTDFKIATPTVGQTFSLSDSIPTTQWWITSSTP